MILKWGECFYFWYFKYIFYVNTFVLLFVTVFLYCGIAVTTACT